MKKQEILDFIIRELSIAINLKDDQRKNYLRGLQIWALEQKQEEKREKINFII